MARRTMSRADALRIINGCKDYPEIAKALNSHSHPAHKLVSMYAQRLHYWAYEHPQTSSGEPVPIDQLPGYAEAVPDELAALNALPPAQARAQLEELRQHEEFQSYLNDSKHPEHAMAQDGWQRLQRRAAGLPAVDDGWPSDEQEQLDWYKVTLYLQPDHPVWDEKHPEHAACLEEYHAVHAELMGAAEPSPATEAPAPAQYTRAQEARAEIDRVRAEARADSAHPYNDARHPEHKAIHRRVNELYQAIYPAESEPVVGADGRGIAPGPSHDGGADQPTGAPSAGAG